MNENEIKMTVIVTNENRRRLYETSNSDVKYNINYPYENLNEDEKKILDDKRDEERKKRIVEKEEKIKEYQLYLQDIRRRKENSIKDEIDIDRNEAEYKASLSVIKKDYIKRKWDVVILSDQDDYTTFKDYTNESCDVKYPIKYFDKKYRYDVIDFDMQKGGGGTVEEAWERMKNYNFRNVCTSGSDIDDIKRYLSALVWSFDSEELMNKLREILNVKKILYDEYKKSSESLKFNITKCINSLFTRDVSSVILMFNKEKDCRYNDNSNENVLKYLSQNSWCESIARHGSLKILKKFIKTHHFFMNTTNVLRGLLYYYFQDNIKNNFKKRKKFVHIFNIYLSYFNYHDSYKNYGLRYEVFRNMNGYFQEPIGYKWK